MRCVRCGTELMEGDRFCPECGAKQEADQTVKDSIPTACPSCGAPITLEMRFCQQCGSPLREAAKSASSANNGSVVTEPVDSATTESMAAESWGVDSADDGKKSPTATYPAQPMPDSPELSSAMDEWSESADADAGGKRNRNIVIAVIAALVIVASKLLRLRPPPIRAKPKSARKRLRKPRKSNPRIARPLRMRA